MGWFDFFSTDPSFREPEEAQQRYLDQVGTISVAKGWPVPVRDRLLQFPWTDDFDPADAKAVYYRAWVLEPQIIEAEGYDPSTLANYQKHRNALQELAEASGLTTQTLADASISSQIAGGISSTAQDVQELAKEGAEQLNPKKSPWPWIIGAGVGLLLLRELQIGDLIKARRK